MTLEELKKITRGKETLTDANYHTSGRNYYTSGRNYYT